MKSKKISIKAVSVFVVFSLLFVQVFLSSGIKAAVASVPAPYNISNNFGQNAGTQLLVTWHNSVAVTTQYIEYTLAEDTSFAQAQRVAVTGGEWSTDGSVGTYTIRSVFRAAVSGLAPDTNYIYRVGDTGSWSATFKHRTAETDGSFSFTGVTDPQSSDHTQMVTTMNLANTFDGDNRFFLNTGDLVDYMGSEPGQIADYASKANQINNERVIATVMGNHDTYNTNNVEVKDESTVYDGFFYNPQNGLAGAGSANRVNTSYYFYYNNVLFVMLNTIITDHASQNTWLRGVLEADKNSLRPAQYIIIGTHYGPFGNYFYNDGNLNAVKYAYGETFSDYKVDLVLTGHDHTYARTNPIKIERNGVVASYNAVEDGTVYMIMGATGPKLGFAGKEQASHQFAVQTVSKLNVGVFVNFKVTRNGLTVSAKAVLGTTVNDEFQIPAKRGWTVSEYGEPEIKVETVMNNATVDFGTDSVINLKKIEILKNDGTSVSGILAGETKSYKLADLKPQSTYYYNVRYTFNDDSFIEIPITVKTESVAAVTDASITIHTVPEGATKYVLYLNQARAAELPVTQTTYAFTGLEAFSSYLIKIEMYNGDTLLGYDYAFVRTTVIS